jgi:hypothetical protein
MENLNFEFVLVFWIMIRIISKKKKHGVEYLEKKKKNSGILNVILFVTLNGEFFLD